MTTDTTPEPRQRTRTRPWMEDEYAIVSGMPCVYTIDKDTKALIVRLPGGCAASVAALRLAGRSVVRPRLVRTCDFT